MSEYHDAMVDLLEMIWGEGFMAPGGEGNVENLVGGLDLKGKRVLDFGCGIGGPAFLLAGKYGANVVGVDIESPLIDLAQKRARVSAYKDSTQFMLVEPGPLDFLDESFDVVFSSGAITQIEDKRSIFDECLRVLKPGGTLTCYDWMKREGEYSEDMLYFFKMEELTYAMETPESQEELLREVGFVDVETRDGSDWYRKQSKLELERIKSELYPIMLETMGKQQADHFVEDWRAMVVVCQSGEMRQIYSRAQKPAKEYL